MLVVEIVSQTVRSYTHVENRALRYVFVTYVRSCKINITKHSERGCTPYIGVILRSGREQISIRIKGYINLLLLNDVIN